jgi:hypothetical protein
MSTQAPRNVAYGLSDPLLNVAQAPIIAQRDPTTKDRAQLGTEWINQLTDNIWFLVKVEDNISTWIQVGGSGGTITFDADFGSAVPSGGILTLTGAGDILTSATGSTVTFTGSGVETVHTGSGDVTVSGNAITITGGNNISTTGSLSTVTVNVSGTSNHQLQVGNASGSLTSLGLATNGQLPIGSTGVNPVLNTLTAGAGVSITNGAGSITIAAMGSVPLTFDADSGSAVPSANTITFAGGTGITTSASGSTVTITSTGATPTYVGDTGTATAISDLLHIRTGYGSGTIDGSGTAQFSASTNFVTLELTDGTGNTILGAGAIPNTGSPGGNDNTGLGDLCMQGPGGGFIGNSNCGVGASCLENITSGNNNTAMGYEAGADLTTATNNCFYGFHSGITLTTGSHNVFIGYESGGAPVSTITGNYNVEIGYEAGVNYTTSESSNVLINSSSTSVVGESHVLRIGNGTGSGNQQLNKAFISGINGVNVGSVASVVSISGDQLGSTTITAGSGISVTPGANTITIAATGAGSSLATITLTNTQIKNLKATPILFIAAQGANTIINPISAVAFLSYGGSNAFVAPSSSIGIVMNYTSDNTNSNNLIGSAMSGGSYSQTASNYQIISSVALNNPGTVVANIVNQPVYLAIQSGASGEITGNAANDNTITIQVEYNVVSVPL